MTTTTTVIQPFNNNGEHLLAALAVTDLRIRWGVARARANGLNPDDAFRGLYLNNGHVDKLLSQELGNQLWPRPNGHAAELAKWAEGIQEAEQTLQNRMAITTIPLRLQALQSLFTLSPFDLNVLLLVIAPEIDPRYERLYAFIQDDVTKKRPSVDLILNLLSESLPAKLQNHHALGQTSPLFRHRLLEKFQDKSSRHVSLLSQFLRPAPSLIAFLTEGHELDQNLRPFVQRHDTSELPTAPWLTPHFVAQLKTSAKRQPHFAFYGIYGSGRLLAALHVAQEQKRPLLSLDLAKLAETPQLLEETIPLLVRDGRFQQALLYLSNWDAILHDHHPPSDLFQHLLDYPYTVFMAGEKEWQPRARQQSIAAGMRRPILRVQFELPSYGGRLQLWQHYLGENTAVNLHHLANQFRFSPGQIEDAVITANDFAQWESKPLAAEHLFAASRAHSNQNLATLATKIKPRYRWQDIVLPADTRNQLREIVNIMQHRHIVYGDWGFDRKLALGKGLSALFSGHPGTGKTMAADIMANELGLDLYKVDLSTLVSKYIGETEKNLDRIFTEAASSNAILFFDEADAIFGKRSEVKDSHDRYANIEISFLLQRMEVYDGVVILATNLQANLDEAFTRRFTFITDFPFPEASDRERIWKVSTPPDTPLADDIDFGLMARRFRIAGGNIRNIILAAAFLAARDDHPVTMRHMLHAARREFQKMGRLIDEAQFALS